MGLGEPIAKVDCMIGTKKKAYDDTPCQISVANNKSIGGDNCDDGTGSSEHHGKAAEKKPANRTGSFESDGQPVCI